MSDDQGRSPDGRATPVEHFLKAFMAATRSFAFYPPEHPASRAALAELEGALPGVIGEGESLVIGLVSGELVVNGLPPEAQVSFGERLAQAIARHNMEKLTIFRGITSEELKNFMIIFGKERADGHEGFNRFLEMRKIERIRAGTVGAAPRPKGSDAVRTGGLQAAENDYRNGLEVSSEINAAAREHRLIQGEKVNALARMLIRGILENRPSFLTVLNLHAKDDYTATHSLDVSLLTLLQMQRFGFGEEALSEIASAALLHDTGKMNVPDAILNKPGRLTDEEWVVMRRHAQWGAEMNHGVRGVGELSITVAFEHHLRFDSTGYPARIRPRPAAVVSMIVAISDAYDAMRSKRPYQDELPPETTANNLLKGSGTAFDPRFVKRFLDLVGGYGLGSLVRLSSGETAVVVRNRQGDPFRPLVRVILDDGERPVEGRLVDLAGEEGVRVAHSLPPEGKYRELLMERGLSGS
jgi:HD-GYP domain-containing protein (c-di-GMP phosphodiesterase class II)